MTNPISQASDWLSLLEGKISHEEIERARMEKSQSRDPAEFLLRRGHLRHDVILSAQSAFYHLPFVNLDRYHGDEEALQLVPQEVARRFLIVPLFRIDTHLYVAVADPDNLTGQDYIRQLTRLDLELVIATKPMLESAINRFFLSKEQSAKKMGELGDNSVAQWEAVSTSDVHIDDSEAPTIKLVNHLLTQAVHLRASDIHLELFSDRVLLRYRIDGVLHEFPQPPMTVYQSIISRIKIMSNLDIAEKRLPQDGRANLFVDGRRYDLRVSIIPNLHGEGVAIRVLDTSGTLKKLDELGLSPEILKVYRQLIHKPYGIILATGPTGSGKSTTLYATMQEIYNPNKKFITLEDPVEYQLSGVTQIQINSDIGFTFAHGLRSVLRHDPDVILVGEIRDLETAQIAIRSSLTGHLVLSTLHTNDSASAVVRLTEMGVEPFMVLASLHGVLAQRLIRTLCRDCKEEAPLSQVQLETLGLKSVPKGTKTYKPVGCLACSNLGYKGRVAKAELLEITPAMRDLSGKQLTPAMIREMGHKEGFHTLRRAAVDTLLSGVTSYEEVMSVTDTM